MGLVHSAKPTVLVVDDDRGAREAAAIVLEEEYEILTAEDGLAALEILHSRRPDVVLLDIVMPGVDGLEVLRRMREANAPVPVIVITGLAQLQLGVEAMRLGALDCFTKPWEDGVLLATVRDAVSGRQSGPRHVLLVGDDLGSLAALRLALNATIRVTTAFPTTVRRLALAARLPALVVLDGALAAGMAASFVRWLRQQCPRAAMLVVLADVAAAMRMPELAVLAPAGLLERPCRLDEMLRRIDTLLASRGLSNGSWERLGPHVLRTMEYMASRFEQRLCVPELARVAGISTHHLAHLFHDRLGIAVKDYLERLRVAVSEDLLVGTDVKIDDIARRCGFADASHFSRVFVNHTGMRPAEYRRWVGLGDARAALRSS